MQNASKPMKRAGGSPPTPVEGAGHHGLIQADPATVARHPAVLRHAVTIAAARRRRAQHTLAQLPCVSLPPHRAC